jgi:alkanesulfonate monooxygenase SsuD/methylene tetrahydromethanopterin reductase-like flavin-dependent oxidoreductase (luciferase family)
MGIGRGDSARRVIGQKPVKVDEFERSCTLIRELMNGRPVRYNETDVELKWVRPELPEIPLYVAGYGPKVLAVAGRVSDGVVIQLADPDIVEWTMGLARRAAEAAGRDPEALEPIVCAPCVVSGDLVAARDQVRWFPAMVSNHVFDLLSKYPKEELPDPSWRSSRSASSTTTRSTLAWARSTARSSTTTRATVSASSGPRRITSRSCAA